MSFAQLRDAAEDLAMWSFKECKLIVQELDDWGLEFNRIPMKKITKKVSKRSGIWELIREPWWLRWSMNN